MIEVIPRIMGFQVYVSIGQHMCQLVNIGSGHTAKHRVVNTCFKVWSVSLQVRTRVGEGHKPPRLTAACDIQFPAQNESRN